MTMDNHEATQHEFVRKALRYFYEDLPEGEYDGSEDDLQEYASTINEGFGYDLDKRIGVLQAENTKLWAIYEEIYSFLEMEGFLNITVSQPPTPYEKQVSELQHKLLDLFNEKAARRELESASPPLGG